MISKQCDVNFDTLIRAVKRLYSFLKCFRSNDRVCFNSCLSTLPVRGTGSLDPCHGYHLAIVSLCYDAQTDSGSVKTG